MPCSCLQVTDDTGNHRNRTVNEKSLWNGGDVGSYGVACKRCNTPGDQTTKKRKAVEETEKEEKTKKKKRQFNKKCKFCTDCRMFSGEKVKEVSFVVGTSNFTVRALKNHKISISLIGSIVTKWVKMVGLLKDSVAMKSLVLKKAELEKMEMLFCNVHALGKKGQPVMDFMWMRD